MKVKVMGDSLAHGIAHRSGREGNQDLWRRATRVQVNRSRFAGKQSRTASFRRWKSDLATIYGDLLLQREESGEGKAHKVADFVLEPAPEGIHSVAVAEMAVRRPIPQYSPLLRFTSHATARLMQSLGQPDTTVAFGVLLPTLQSFREEMYLGDAVNALVLIDPIAGWMPACRTDDGVFEVRTVIPFDSLGSKGKRALFNHCVERGCCFLVETRVGPNISRQIGSDSRSLVIASDFAAWVLQEAS